MYMVLGQGARWSAWKGCGVHECDDQNGRALLERRRAGQDRENKTEMKAGCDQLTYLCTQEHSIYCGARGDRMVCTEAERSCAQLWEDLELCRA